MADLRTTDGGGGEAGDDSARIAEAGAAWAFEKLAVEMLRGIARGGQSSYPVGSALYDLYGHLTTDEVRLFPAIQSGLQALKGRLLPDDNPCDEELRWLLRAAIRLAAERLATDGFAKGRASQRENDFRHDLERYLLNKEERARKYGGSYLMSLLAQFPPLPPSSAKSRKGRMRKSVEPFKL
ncbi:hypothetical protein [Aquabacter cavernae]|uniref:hypothetical protein n=1 Tax=Aquabacter cavernae TaxID=2496029 RepID=UPI000F8E6822|nr:hypothetical protein [Aquabacter cavernae]